MSRVKILAAASIQPGRVVDNREMAALLGCDAEEILRSCEIQSRRYLQEGDTGAKWAARVAKQALSDIGKQPADLQAIFYSTMTPDHQFPGNAAFTQKELGISEQAILDIRACDGGFFHTLTAAVDFIRVGRFDVLMLGANEFFSTYLRMTPQGAGVTELFGDGAAVWILGPSGDDSGLLSVEVGNDPTRVRAFWAKTPGVHQKPRMTPETVKKGQWHFSLDIQVMKEETLRLMPRIAGRAMEKADITPEEVNWFIPASLKASWGDRVSEELGLSRDKLVSIHEGQGYCGTAMVPTAMDRNLRSGRFRKGDLVLAASVGAGISFGAMVYRV